MYPVYLKLELPNTLVFKLQLVKIPNTHKFRFRLRSNTTMGLTMALLSLLCFKGFAQTAPLSEFLNHICNESKNALLLSKKDTGACFRKLRESFIGGETYLRMQLKDMVLGDTSSAYYRQTKEKLSWLEKRRAAETPSGDQDLLLQYYLVSVIKPSHSYEYFNNILMLCFQVPGPEVVPKKSLPFIHYKLWLYMLLQERFPEVTQYKTIVATTYYNKIVRLSEENYTSVAAEERLERQMEATARQAAIPGFKKSLNDILTDIYLSRAEVLVSTHANHHPDSLFRFAERMLFKALAVSPRNYAVNRNLGALYNNQVAYYYNEVMGSSCFGNNKANVDSTGVWKEKSKKYLEIAREIKESK